MTEKEFKKVALVNVDGEYIAPVASYAVEATHAVNADSAITSSNGVNIDSKFQDISDNIQQLQDVSVTHPKNSSVGSPSYPVYIKADGGVALCTSINSTLIGSPMITYQYNSGKSGYRIWSNGFKEVWGYNVGQTGSAGSDVIVTFPNTGVYAFTNANSIHVFLGIRTDKQGDVGGIAYARVTGCVPTVTTSSFHILRILRVDLDWYAFGY